MTSRRSLDLVESMVVDASVVINLLTVEQPVRILRALQRRVVVTEDVVEELEQGRKVGYAHASLLAGIVAEQHVGVVQLGARGREVFNDLTIGPANDTLDDGEAATLAYALESGAEPVIDERKAIRICARRFPNLNPLSSIDLLAAPNVETALGRDVLGKVVFDALQRARMRVLPQHLGRVITLIGPERARSCSSLPKKVREDGVSGRGVERGARRGGTDNGSDGW